MNTLLFLESAIAALAGTIKHTGRVQTAQTGLASLSPVEYQVVM